MNPLRKKLVERLLATIPGLKERSSTVAGGAALFYGGTEFAHSHHDREIDVRLTKTIIFKR